MVLPFPIEISPRNIPTADIIALRTGQAQGQNRPLCTAVHGSANEEVSNVCIRLFIGLYWKSSSTQCKQQNSNNDT